MVTVVARKWGNGRGVLLPKKVLEEKGINLGEPFEIEIKQKKRFLNGFGMAKGAGSFIREKGDLDREF